jgi:hypothetical protein
LRHAGIAFLSAALLTGAAAPNAEAQLLGSGRLAWGATVGWESLTGDMGDYLRSAPSFGLHLLYDVVPRVSIGVETNFVGHDGRYSQTVGGVGIVGQSRTYIGPPTQLVRAGVTGEVAILMPAGDTGFSLVAGAGAGMGRMISEKLYDPENPGGVIVPNTGSTSHAPKPLQFGGTNPVFSGLLRAGYQVNPAVTLYVEGAGYTTSIDDKMADGRPKSIVFVIGDSTLEPPTSWSSMGLRFGIRKSF